MSQEPIKPDDSECCGSGCKPCIFDVYEEKLIKWKSGKNNISETRGLDQIKYSPFLITLIENITKTVKIYKFQTVLLKKQDHNGVLIQNSSAECDYELLEGFFNIKAGEYLIMKGFYEANGKTVTISRSYTPVINDDLDKGTFTVIVSFLENGKMSQFFQKLTINDIVFWRGPYTEFTYRANSFRNVFLIGGGTGIVPLYNISKSIVENEMDETWVSVLCSFKNVESILLRKELGALTNYWNFKVEIFISNQANSNFKLNYNESVNFKRVDETVIKTKVKKYDKDEVLIVVCGPDLFTKFVKETLAKCNVKEENIFVF